MKSDRLVDLLKSYSTADAYEKQMVSDTIHFIQNNENCFERSLATGHVTGSAWIINPEKTHVLLIHHRKLDKWLQPGGHCDGDSDVMAVAAKEAFEETGIKVKPVSEEIFDVDIHEIPERKGVPEHRHYDIRFLFKASKESDTLPGNHETNEVRWIPIGSVPDYNAEASIQRMVLKTKL